MQLDLLALLLLQPEREWTLDELATTLRAVPSSVHRELNRAVDAGITSRTDDRRPYVYRAAESSPIYEPLRELLDRTVGVPGRLRRVLEGFESVRAAVIHGSWTTAAVRPTSDIDVLVVADGDRRAIQRAVRQVGRDVGREIDLSLLTSESYDALRKEGNPFLEGIVHGPIIPIVGELDLVGETA